MRKLAYHNLRQEVFTESAIGTLVYTGKGAEPGGVRGVPAGGARPRGHHAQHEQLGGGLAGRVPG